LVARRHLGLRCFKDRDDGSILSPFSSVTWELASDSTDRNFMVIQTGNNWAGNHWISVLQLAIYGEAVELKDETGLKMPSKS
jgi:hypothetical protein